MRRASPPLRAIEDEQALVDRERTLADSDARFADDDQIASDSDQTSADNDQLPPTAIRPPAIAASRWGRSGGL